MAKKRIHRFENNKTYWYTTGIDMFLPEKRRKKGNKLIIKDSWGRKKSYRIRNINISGNGIKIQVWNEEL